MKQLEIKSIQQCIQNKGLTLLLQRIEKHRILLKLIREALPEALSIHCVECVAKEDDQLILFTRSQAFAAKLRFYTPLISESLQTNGFGYKKITLRIIKDQTAIQQQNLNIKPPSENVVKALTTLKEALNA